MSRTLALLLGLVLALGACSATADPAAPADGPPGTPAPRAVPYRLERPDTVQAVRALRTRGFSEVLVCRSRQREECQREGTARARWLVGAQSRGAALARGQGLAEYLRTVVTAWPSPARARSYADRLATKLRPYDGDYDLALRSTGPQTYRPGDRGMGEIQEVSMHGWRGIGLRRVFHYVFFDLSPSANVLGGHFVLQRGRYVVDLEWESRDQATDRRLSQLPRRLLAALG